MPASRLRLTGLFLLPLALWLLFSVRPATPPPLDPEGRLKPKPRWTPNPGKTALPESRGPAGMVATAATPALSPRPVAVDDRPAPRAETTSGPPARSIPGLDAAGLLDALGRAGLGCSSVSFDGGGVTWTCSADGARAGYVVVVHGDDTSSITWLRATVSRADSDFLAARFLAAIAGLDYGGAEPARAVDWVNRTFPGEGTATIASVRFVLSGAPGARTLDMAAEGLRR
jgi:hypothetical protein